MRSILSALASPKVLLVLGLLAAAALALLVFLYRRRVKKTAPADSAGEAALRRGKLGRLLSVLFLAACLLGLLIAVCLLWIRLRSLQSSMSSGLTSISNKIDMTRQVLYRQIREESSLLSDCEWKVLRANLPAGSLDVQFTAVPKAAGEDTVLSLRIDEQDVRLQRDKDGIYEGRFSVDPFDSLRYDAILSLNDQGFVRTEKLELSFLDWRDEYFPALEAEITDFTQSWAESGWSDSVHASLRAILNAPGSGLRSLSVIVRQGDTVLEEISLDDKLNEYELWYKLALDGDYPLGAVTEYQLQYTDLHHYVHVRSFLVLRPDGTRGEVYPERIYDEAGNLLGRIEWEDPNLEEE